MNEGRKTYSVALKSIYKFVSFTRDVSHLSNTCTKTCVSIYVRQEKGKAKNNGGKDDEKEDQM